MNVCEGGWIPACREWPGCELKLLRLISACGMKRYAYRCLTFCQAQPLTPTQDSSDDTSSEEEVHPCTSFLRCRLAACVKTLDARCATIHPPECVRVVMGRRQDATSYAHAGNLCGCEGESFDRIKQYLFIVFVFYYIKIVQCLYMFGLVSYPVDCLIWNIHIRQALSSPPYIHTSTRAIQTGNRSPGTTKQQRATQSW